MVTKYEIRYYFPKTGHHHYDDAGNLEEALWLMKECKKETKSKCISLIWRPYTKISSAAAWWETPDTL